MDILTACPNSPTHHSATHDQDDDSFPSWPHHACPTSQWRCCPHSSKWLASVWIPVTRWILHTLLCSFQRIPSDVSATSLRLPQWYFCAALSTCNLLRVLWLTTGTWHSPFRLSPWSIRGTVSTLNHSNLLILCQIRHTTSLLWHNPLETKLFGKDILYIVG